MRLSHHTRVFLVALLTGVVVCPPASALVSLNDGKEKIYISASTTIAHDSNIFAQSGGAGDYVTTSSLSLEYTRRVGWIGVNAGLSYSIGSFKEFSRENYKNPGYTAEFTKQTGRTTGSLTLNAQRSSRADASVNLRNTSWSYGAGLNFRYPVIERYSLSGNVTYSLVDYSNNDLFVDLSTYGASINLFYILSDARDISIGYRFRESMTSKSTSTTDQAVNFGINGRVLPMLNGAVQFGYQKRTPHGGISDQVFTSFFASGSTSFNFNRKTSGSLTVSKDFSTTATDITIDNTTVSLSFTYVLNSHWSADASVGWNSNLFLGTGGLVDLDGTGPLDPIRRRDRAFTYGAGVNYSLNEHFKASFNYNHSTSSSNVSFSDFSRQGYSLTLSTRW